MILEVRAGAPFFKNGFVAACERTREAVLIDPGDEVADLLDLIRREALRLRYILLTHAHIDHVTGVAAAKQETGAPVYLHQGDLPLYEHVVEQGQLFGLAVTAPPPVDRFYDGAPLPFGELDVRVHHTPGHCPGGVCLQVGRRSEAGNDLFVGDTLFAGSIGRTDLPGGDYETLMRSISDVLFPLGDDRIVHPGHGPDTTIGKERRTNPFVREYFSLKGTKTT